jgi:hypothetical protein
VVANGRICDTVGGVDGALIPSAHHGHDPYHEKRPHVHRHLARPALAVTAARTASGPAAPSVRLGEARCSAERRETVRYGNQS